MKKCTKCLIEQELIEFPSSKKGRLYTWCKACIRENSRKWYAANTERSNATRKKYYEQNREKTLAKTKEWYLKNYERIRKRANERNRNPEARKKQNEAVKKWARERKEKVAANVLKYRRNNPEKCYATQAVMWAVRLGVLKKPNECGKCMRVVKLQGHHEDYSKPLDVQWVCKICHNHIHNKLLDVNPREEI
jgi:hypothetical protein